MKPYYFLFTLLVISKPLFAQSNLKVDTSKKDTSKTVFVSIESLPEYPGGMAEFAHYISKNVKYPEVAKLIGINGRVVVTFVIDRDGTVTNVTPMNCIGAGCEAEAVNVLQNSPVWKPGIQKGKTVRVQYSVPISFNMPKTTVYIDALKRSDYGFVFDIKGERYTIEEAENLLGKKFSSDQILIADPFYNSNNIEKFKMPGKKEVYLLKIKSQ